MVSHNFLQLCIILRDFKECIVNLLRKQKKTKEHLWRSLHIISRNYSNMIRLINLQKTKPCFDIKILTV